MYSKSTPLNFDESLITGSVVKYHFHFVVNYILVMANHNICTGFPEPKSEALVVKMFLILLYFCMMVRFSW